MNSMRIFSALGILIILLSGCGNKNNWEYKVIYFDAQKITAPDKNYLKTSDFFERTISSTTIVPSDESLNSYGKDGWELVTSYLENETVFPNLVASGSSVDGVQSNVRPQRLVLIFKRQGTKKSK